MQHVSWMVNQNQNVSGMKTDILGWIEVKVLFHQYHCLPVALSVPKQSSQCCQELICNSIFQSTQKMHILYNHRSTVCWDFQWKYHIFCSFTLEVAMLIIPEVRCVSLLVTAMHDRCKVFNFRLAVHLDPSLQKLW